MQDNISQNFDIFDLFFVIKKNIYKYVFFSFLFFSVVFSIFHFLNDSKKELHIKIFIEDDLFLPSKYNALSNFIMLSKNKVVMSNLKTNLDNLEYSYYFLTRHIDGISGGILSHPLSSEYQSFFESSFLKKYESDIQTLNIVYDGDKIEKIDQVFLNKLVDELNYRVHSSLIELMKQINSEIKKLDNLLHKELNNFSNLNKTNDVFKNINEQNKKTIQVFQDSDIEKYFILKEIEVIKFEKLSIRYYLSAILLYFFLISFSSILLVGYELKKKN